MSEAVEFAGCEQCGRRLSLAELTIDEETGMVLCLACGREQESCGCSDEAE